MNKLEMLEPIIDKKAHEEALSLGNISIAVDKGLESILGTDYVKYKHLLWDGERAVRDALVKEKKSEIIKDLIPLS